MWTINLHLSFSLFVRKGSCSLNMVPEVEMAKLIWSLNVHKSTGCDKISAIFLTNGASVITSPVTYSIYLLMRKSEVHVYYDN